MRLTYKQLKKYGVETVSGRHLGHVSDVVFDADLHAIVQYEVRSLPLAGTAYLIGRDQVVRFDDGVMVVQDTLSPVERPARVPRASIKPEPVAMREAK